MLRKKIFSASILLALLTGSATLVMAQIDGTAIDQWTSIYSYNDVVDVVEDGTTFFVGTQSGFYTYNRSNGELESYSKTSGMANPGVAALGHDGLTGVTVLAYQNSNIDLFHEGVFFNIPSLFLSQSSGNKAINNVVCHEGLAYLSTGKGLIVLDLKRKEIKETVVFYANGVELTVQCAAVIGSDIYVATTAGVYKTNLNNPSFIYYGTWEIIDTNTYSNLLSINQNLFASNTNKLYKYQAGTGFELLHTHTESIASLYQVMDNKIGIAGYSQDRYMATSGLVIEIDGSVYRNFGDRKVVKYFELPTGVKYYGEYRLGLRKEEDGQFVNYIPNAVSDYKSADVYAYGGDLVIAHGGVKDNLNPILNSSIYSIYKNNRFEHIPWISNNYTFIDFIRVIKSEKSSNIYAAAYGGGVSEFRPDFGTTDYVSQLEPRKGELPEKYYVYGLALDEADNLWVVNSGTNKLLKVKTPDGQWYSSMDIVNPLTASLPLATQSLAGDVIIDKNGLKWIIPLNAGGIIVYDDNQTISDNTDDNYKVLQSGAGRGNLPSNRVLCAAVDKNNNLWVGTDDGIGIFYCMTDLNQGCDADIPVIQNDEHPGYLFQDMFVTSIAVDGANRKWIGTNTGLWLVSDDGRTTLHQFTTTNSPLPSNNIKRINIDPITGDVYISTDMGLVRYKGTATEGRVEMEKPLEIYPNPVPSGFSGMIAINGLAENADVRIVDMNGQLVYRTTANGGQAVWNGHDYLGKRAQSGVYLVLVRGKDGIEKGNGKIIFRE